MAESSLGGIFNKAPDGKKDDTPAVPAVPVGRLVASPRRQLGRGTRDTILTGSDGLK
jgi:hypothetical protein